MDETVPTAHKSRPQPVRLNHLTGQDKPPQRQSVQESVSESASSNTGSRRQADSVANDHAARDVLNANRGQEPLRSTNTRRNRHESVPQSRNPPRTVNRQDSLLCNSPSDNQGHSRRRAAQNNEIADEPPSKRVTLEEYERSRDDLIQSIEAQKLEIEAIKVQYQKAQSLLYVLENNLDIMERMQDDSLDSMPRSFRIDNSQSSIDNELDNEPSTSGPRVQFDEDEDSDTTITAGIGNNERNEPITSLDILRIEMYKVTRQHKSNIDRLARRIGVRKETINKFMAYQDVSAEEFDKLSKSIDIVQDVKNSSQPQYLA